MPWALILAVTSPARATVILPADLDTIVNGSHTIVHGRVIDVRSDMTAGRRSIYSVVTLAVDRTLKGNGGATVAFRIPVGQVGRYRRVIVGAPEFAAGDEVVVFLTGAAPALPTIFGLNQGVYRARGAPAGALEALTARVRAIAGRVSTPAQARAIVAATR
jgi:hypothetical protein